MSILQKGNTTQIDINKKNRQEELNKIITIKELLFANDHQFIEIFYNYIELDDMQSAKEIKFKHLKKVLTDYSIKFSIDFDGVQDVINAKYAHLVGISYSQLKESILEWLDNTQKVLTNTIIYDDSKIKSVPISNIVFNSNEEKNLINEKLFDFSSEVDVNMIVFQRSIYLLKKKFELYEKDIKSIYDSKAVNKRNLSTAGIEVDIKDIEAIIKDILNKAEFSFCILEKASELFKIEVLEKINHENVKLVIDELIKFIKIHRERYNDIIKEKRGYKNLLVEESKNEEEVMINQTDAKAIKSIEGSKIESKTAQKEDSKNIKISEKNAKDNKVSNKPSVKDSKIDKSVIDKNKNLASPIKSNEKEKSEQNSKQNSKSPIENIDKSNKTNNALNTPSKNVEKSRNSPRKENAKSVVSKNTIDSNDTSLNQNNQIVNQLNQPEQEVKIEAKEETPNNILFIEYLPYIIIDFITENKSVAVTDIKNELKNELKSLFDNEIFQRLGEQAQDDIESLRIMRIKEFLFDRMNIDNNLRVYEDLLLKKKSMGENTVFIEQMLQKLKLKRIILEREITKLQDDNETINNYKQIETQLSQEKSMIKTIKEKSPIRQMNIEEKRKQSFKQIFTFYSKQHLVNGLSFEEIERKRNMLDLSEFVKFCLEFRIPCKKEIIVEVFKKTATKTKEMTFDEFLASLRTLSVKINEDRIALLGDRIKKLDNIGKEPTKSKSEYLKQKRQLINKSKNSKSPEVNVPVAVIKEEPKNIKVIPNEKEESKNNKNKNKDLEVKNAKETTDVKNAKQKDSKETKPKAIESSKAAKDTTSNKSNEKEPQINKKESTKTQKTVQSKNSPKKDISVEKPKDEEVKPQIEENPLKKEIKEEKIKIQSLISELKQKPFEQLREELLIYLEIDNEKDFKSKMKGFILPFHTSQKQGIEQKESNKKSKDPRTAAEIRRIIQERKEEAIRKEIEKERLLKLKYFEERKKLKKMNDDKHKEYERQHVKESVTYLDIKQKEINYEREKSYKITWDQLEQLNPNYFVTNKEDDFNPQELLGDQANDSEDEQLNNMVNKRDFTKDTLNKKKTTLNRSGFSSSVIHSQGNNSDVKVMSNINNTKEKAIKQENAWNDQKNKLLNHNEAIIKKSVDIINKKKK